MFWNQSDHNGPSVTRSVTKPIKHPSGGRARLMSFSASKQLYKY